MFMDHLAFDMKPWDIEDPITGKREIYMEDKNILRKMYKLKNLFEKQSQTSNNKNLIQTTGTLIRSFTTTQKNLIDCRILSKSYNV